MKYSKQIPKTDDTISKQLLKDGWVKIKEPAGLAMAILYSLPFMFLLSGMTAWLAYLLKPELFRFFASQKLEFTIQLNLKPILFIVTLFIYMFLHEMIHALFIPNVIHSNKTYWGINGLFGFVASNEPMTKERFLIVSCMPFLLLSIGTLFLFDLIGFLNGYTFLLCLLNAAGSCVDFLNMILIAIQVKSKHTIINNGSETFYYPSVEQIPVYR